jgi:RNA polymerase sigma factor (sigma-70 family)
MIELLRELAPQVLGVIVRRYRDFAAAEDAVQEALLAASQQWTDGVPDQPRAWLIKVASRRMIDHVRSEVARREREASSDEPGESERDDTLELLFTCCHPALSPSSAIALTLRAVGGLTTVEIARAFLVPEATMAQRISRAKATIQSSGIPLAVPTEPTALSSVMHVLYLIFNEGYASAGPNLVRTDLAHEAIRMARMLARAMPDAEVQGLLALMLLTDARRIARTGSAGELIPLDEQDRSRWNRAQVAEGTHLVTDAFARGSVGRYQIQAAIAAIHDEAVTTEATDWPQILTLYSVLLGIDDNPLVALNHAVAIAMVQGPRAGLARLVELEPRLGDHHRLIAVRAHLLERAGDPAAAAEHYKRAASRTTSAIERDYLLARASLVS